MKGIRQFFSEKGTGFYLTVGAFAALLAAMVCFILLFSSSSAVQETPSAVLGLVIAGIAVALITAVRDFWGIGSVALLALSSASFFVFLYGRVEYLAYYFSGDIQGTGLSVWCVLTLIFLLASVVLSAMAIFFSHKKTDA